MTPTSHTVVHRFAAMGTRFEVILAGDDGEHLEAVAAAVEDEVRRLEGVLSRFDPASEVARVNREASIHAVRLSVELWDLLVACESYRASTPSFDVTAGSTNRTRPRLLLDPPTRSVRFAGPGIHLDFGAIGKGYALDQAGSLLRRFGITSGLLHGGTSSVLAIGADPNGAAWRVAIRHPQGGEDTPVLGHLDLMDRGFSCSAVRHPAQEVSDILDPETGQPLPGRATCLVLAPTATTAEWLSTALLSQGRQGASDALRRCPFAPLEVAWIDAEAAVSRIEWLTGEP